MKTSENEKIAKLLKESVPPIGRQTDAGPRGDLWPALLRKLEAGRTIVPWTDWALLAAVVVLLALFPKTIPILFYYL